jgi:hypothetical protein
MTHDSRAAGPAIFEALSAPNSQPEPMIEPTEVNNRPTTPISRRRRRLVGAAEAGSGRCAVAMRRTLLESRAARGRPPGGYVG